MATPYVPVPIPIGSSSSSFTNRNQRSSSFGSISTSSSSSKGQLEDSTIGSFKKMSVPDQIGSTSSVCSSPLVRTKFTGMDTSIEYCTQPSEEIEQNTDSRSWEDRPSTPTILGYEVMEERAKFTLSREMVIFCLERQNLVFKINGTKGGCYFYPALLLLVKQVYKILVKRSPDESWVVFRRYTDFSRLNDKAFCETLEETNYRLQKELLEKQKEVESLKKLLHEKQLHIDAVERRIRDLSLGKMTRQMSGEGSECSGEVESSAVEADQGTLGEDSCSDKENHDACWSGSLPENSVPEIEVAEVAYTADEEE
ncbi:sorting nexin-16 isoform X3 [Strigops habroptila]|uniref:sorting nexin-16 isoform X3 n=1 Tax=Strigops habroptila TaxID=2489341 RepID=UPI0011CFEAFE|nr:sorting nexin-16 isoform X3 [Strigops habroptila]